MKKILWVTFNCKTCGKEEKVEFGSPSSKDQICFKCYRDKKSWDIAVGKKDYK